MKNLVRRMPDALLRIGVVFGMLLVIFLLVRFLLPESMKSTEAHVNATVAREVARPVNHAGSDVCAECHEEYNVKKSGYHKTLSCETCHGPAKQHTEDPGEHKPTMPRMREFCVRCHTYDPSRPTGFPQINPAGHNPLKPCVSCHNPHDPKPPTAPQECQGCHAEIARTKALSTHVLLECTTCHDAPAEHRTAPRSVKPSIPRVREFCGKCHAKGSQVKDTPKVDIATHGEKYLCWQCHYPHMPEVK